MKMTFLSNNCLAGFLYKDYEMEFCSPTINLQMTPLHFLKFCLNLNHYLSLELEKISTDEALEYFKIIGGGGVSTSPLLGLVTSSSFFNTTTILMKPN